MRQKIKKECKNCGKTFITFDESVEFCNLGCKEDFENPLPQEEIRVNKGFSKVCAFCGKEFKAGQSRTKFCSQLCSRRAYSEAMAKEHKCLDCGRSLADRKFAKRCEECQKRRKSAMSLRRYHKKKGRTSSEVILLREKMSEARERREAERNKQRQRLCHRCGIDISTDPRPHVKYCRECLIITTRERMRRYDDLVKKLPLDVRGHEARVESGRLAIQSFLKNRKPKYCELCESEFMPEGPKQKYCFECRREIPKTKVGRALYIKLKKEQTMMKKKETVMRDEPTRNPVTHNYVDLRIDFENQLEQLKKCKK